MLTGLLSTANVALSTAAPGVDTSALQGVIGTLGTVLGASGGGGTPAGPGTTTPKGTPGTPKTGQSVFTLYRATISGLKVAKNRRSATMSVSCPSLAPKGCLVVIDGAIGNAKAFAQKVVVVMRNVRQSVAVKLTTVTGNRLKKKGGSLKVTAKTVNGTLSAVTSSVKVARPKLAKKKVARKR
jgi:hypothetical protein